MGRAVALKLRPCVNCRLRKSLLWSWEMPSSRLGIRLTRVNGHAGRVVRKHRASPGWCNYVQLSPRRHLTKHVHRVRQVCRGRFFEWSGDGRGFAGHSFEAAAKSESPRHASNLVGRSSQDRVKAAVGEAEGSQRLVTRDVHLIWRPWKGSGSPCPPGCCGLCRRPTQARASVVRFPIAASASVRGSEPGVGRRAASPRRPS